MKNFVVTLLLSFIFQTFVFSQTDSTLEFIHENVLFPLIQVSLQNDSSKLIAVIKNGTSSELKNGMTGFIFKGINDTLNMKTTDTLGKTTITECSANYATIQIVKTTNTIITNADIASFFIDFTAPEYRSVLFDLVVKGIDLINISGQKIIDITNATKANSVVSEKIILDSLLIELKIVADTLVGKVENVQITNGIFSGKQLSDALKISTTGNIKSFLRYMVVMSNQYKAKSWRFAEVYSSWLINGAPITYIDLKESLQNAKNDSEFNFIMQTYKSDFNDNTILQLNQDAIYLANCGDLNEAYKLNELAIKCSSELSLNISKADGLKIKGEIAAKETNTNLAAKCFNDAMAIYQSLNDEMNIARLHNRLGFIFSENDEFAKADDEYARAETSFKKIMINDSTDVPLFLLTQNTFCIGDNFYRQKNYATSLEKYNQALSLIENKTSKDAKNIIESVYSRLSIIYNDMGETDKSEEYYKKMLDIENNLQH